jgi:hypothetical protein
MVTTMDKALIALFGAGLYFAGEFWGFSMEPDRVDQVQNAIMAVTPILVWLIPNRRA